MSVAACIEERLQPTGATVAAAQLLEGLEFRVADAGPEGSPTIITITGLLKY
jgi:hypothetical protein